MIKAIYSRYYTTQISQCESVKDAINLIKNMEDHGEGFGIGVFDEVTGILYVDETEIIGKSIEELKRDKIERVENLGFEVKAVELFNAVHNES